jgi:hypothetical protein
VLIAVALELACMVTLFSSSDASTRVAGLIIVCAYAWYSATWNACQRIGRWLRDYNDRRGPPPTGA